MKIVVVFSVSAVLFLIAFLATGNLFLAIAAICSALVALTRTQVRPGKK